MESQAVYVVLCLLRVHAKEQRGRLRGRGSVIVGYFGWNNMKSNTLAKLHKNIRENKTVYVIPEYKCRKCGVAFEHESIMYQELQYNYTCFHSECYIFADCSEDYIGVADLQGFRIMTD